MIINIYNASSFIMDLTALFMLLGITLSTDVMRKRGRRDDRIFFRLLILNAIVAVSDMAVYYYYLKPDTGRVESYIQTAALTVYFLSIILFAMAFLYYVDAESSKPEKLKEYQDKQKAYDEVVKAYEKKYGHKPVQAGAVSLPPDNSDYKKIFSKLEKAGQSAALSSDELIKKLK